MKQRVLITAALPYPNGPLHFGHIAGAYLPADCYARFERLLGKEVLYISGSDCYGIAIALQAKIEGRTPEEQANHYHGINTALFKKMGISFDHFSKTTTPHHKPLVEQFFNDLLKNGYIEKRETEQLYSEADSQFLADRYVLGTCPKCGYEKARGDECGECGASFEATDLINPCSKLSDAPLSLKKTTHWFLCFDKFGKKLALFLESKNWKPNVTHFARHYIEEIRARAITRDLNWGVPVPLKEADGKVFYVWFDAPIGYISATVEWAETQNKPELWKEFWCDPKTKYVQFIGKDNIPFHALFFPAMIMGQNQPYKLVDELVANEFYKLEGRQFSKSEGWLIDLDSFFKHFTADQIRYAIAASLPETADSEFNWKEFQMRCNSELLGKFGNFVNRVLVFAKNKLDGKIPAAIMLEQEDHRFIDELARLAEAIQEAYASFRLRKASHFLMELASVGNAYFDAKAPWKDVKESASLPAAETTIAFCLEAIKHLSLLSYPIVPETAEKIWKMLGFDASLIKETLDISLNTPLTVGKVLPKPSILFEKVEDALIEEQIKRLKAMSTPTPTLSLEPLKEQIMFDDFCKLDLRVGLIESAEKVAKSKKLLLLTVDIGLEKRALVSGISQFYAPEELVGKKVVVVANLKPAKIMGIESNGMVLAGSLDKALEVVAVSDLPPGAQVS